MLTVRSTLINSLYCKIIDATIEENNLNAIKNNFAIILQNGIIILTYGEDIAYNISINLRKICKMEVALCC